MTWCLYDCRSFAFRKIWYFESDGHISPLILYNDAIQPLYEYIRLFRAAPFVSIQEEKENIFVCCCYFVVGRLNLYISKYSPRG